MSLGNKQIMAENIKRLLEQKGLNPRQMAIELGFKYTTVNDWVNAKSYPRIDKIEIMANFFNVSKSALVEEYNPASDKQADPFSDSEIELSSIDERVLMFDGKPLTDDDRRAIRALIEIYINGKGG